MNRRTRKNNRTDRADRMDLPSILIVGDESCVPEVETALKKLKAKLTTDRWSHDTISSLDEATTAIVLVTPIEGTTTVRAIRTIRGQPFGKEIPLFAVLSKVGSKREIRSLYSGGVSAVFDWPAEADVLPYCLAEMIAANFVRGRASHPDTALARTTRTQLKTRCDFNHRVRVRVVDGVAFMNGSVNQLWQKQRIKEVAMSVPGLKGVIDRDVFVLPTGVPDKDINDSIKRMMRDVSEIDERTLAVRVENGYVYLAGSVDSRAEANRLTRLVANIRGVRDVAPLTIVSPSQKRQDHRIAKRLQTMLRQLFIGEDVNVAFFGKTAVLSGKVSSLFTKQRIAQTLEDEAVVDRIVNKLKVSQSGEA